MTRELRSHLKQQGIGASGITSFASAVSAPLRWGEAVPLWFMEEAFKAARQEQEDADKPRPSYVVLTQPARRMSEPTEMVPELRRLGEAISAFTEARSERVAVVISGDLAHTHSSSPDSPYPWSSAAAPFGTATDHSTWATT
jgi:aromatic ring-opening dioxygenase LigB subunit